MSCTFGHMSLNPSNILWRKCTGEVMPQVVKTHSHQFQLGELLRTLKSKSPPLQVEVHDFFVFPLLSFDELQNAYPSLGVVERLDEFLFHCLPAYDGSLGKIHVPSKHCSF